MSTPSPIQTDSPSVPGPQAIEMEQKLYALLVDQLTKYNTIIWQFPTALLAANAFAIDKAHDKPLALLVLLVLALANFSFAYD